MKPTLLMIDSGASNSNWKFMASEEDHEVLRFKGFNLSTSHIQAFKFDIPEQYVESIQSVFFFGAGTGDFEKEEELKLKLYDLFPNLNTIKIGSDLLTAGLALSSGKECVISILGTGSNCCIFADSRIKEKVNNLGYLLRSDAFKR